LLARFEQDGKEKEEKRKEEVARASLMGNFSSLFHPS
jgi:hypothetical protein